MCWCCWILIAGVALLVGAVVAAGIWAMRNNPLG